MASKYVLHEVCEGQYRFTLISHGGQVLLTSGLFMDKESAIRKIAANHSLLQNARNYDLLTAEDGGLYFTVVTRKGETLAYSATYPDAEGRQAAINRAKQYNRGARFEDLTLSAVHKPERPVALSTRDSASARHQKKKSACSKFILREEGKDRYLIFFQTQRGQILLTSQVRYKDIALSQIRAARTLGQNEENYAVHKAKEGGSYFAIQNTQGETVALSETYPDPESMLRGIDLVKGTIAGARLEDLTLPPSPAKTGRFYRPSHH